MVERHKLEVFSFALLSRSPDAGLGWLRALRSGPRLREVVAAVARSYKAELAHVLGRARGRTEARDIAVHLAREFTGARESRTSHARLRSGRGTLSLAGQPIKRMVDRIIQDRMVRSMPPKEPHSRPERARRIWSWSVRWPPVEGSRSAEPARSPHQQKGCQRIGAGAGEEQRSPLRGIE